MLKGHCRRDEMQVSNLFAKRCCSYLAYGRTCFRASVTANGSIAYEMRPSRAAAVQAFAAMLLFGPAKSGSLNGAFA